MEDELENQRLFRVGSGSRSLQNLRPIDDPYGSFTLNGQQAMKDQDWTWKQVAIFVGLVFAMIGVATITLWIVWNSPALLP